MKVMSREKWVGQVLRQLERAREKDIDQQVFGANSHKYRLEPPVNEDEIQAFEHKHGIRLPEEYRNFLLLAGNGGAGPYYGIYGLKELEREIKDDYYFPQSEPIITPDMSDEEWNRIAELEEECGEGNRHPFAGILPIGTQGCTYMTGIILRGPYFGQVVYYDLDFGGKPFFVRERGFLAWYERWLREVIAGYEIYMFGMNLDGNEQQLMERYQQTDDTKEKIEIIGSYYKFQKLPKKQKMYFKQICDQETDMEIRMRLVKMLAHFRVDGMAGQIEKLWEYGAYAEAVSVITYEGGWEAKEKWFRQILDIMPKLRGNAFRDACYTFKALKEHPDVNAELLKGMLLRRDLDRNDRAVLIYCIGELDGREAILDYFLDYLTTENDVYLLITAIQALKGIRDRRLQEIYVRLLDYYRTDENVKKDYQNSQMILKGGGCLAASTYQGQLVNNLIRGLDSFESDYRNSWGLFMDNSKWEKWKQQYGFM